MGINAGSFAGMPPGLQSPRAAKQRQEKDKIQGLQSKYAGSCACAAGNCQEHSAEDFLNKVRAESRAHVEQHEARHQSGNPYAGPAQFEVDSNGVTIGGHVDISMPPLDPRNPEDGYKAYSIIRGSALAPGDPSGQDMAVAAQASSLMGQAQVLMSQKKAAEKMGLQPGQLTQKDMALAAFSGKGNPAKPNAGAAKSVQNANPQAQTDPRRNPLNLQA